MKLKQLKNEKGFTIIEVLIVLAIAGLIMLVVFLAVPALQRNARNTQRNSDASLLASAVNECLGNRNGQVASCNTAAQLANFIDYTRFSQLTNTVEVNTPATLAHPGTATTVAFNARIYFGQRCNADGATWVVPAAGTAAGSPRDFIVLFRNEGTGNSVTRCLSS